MKTNINFQWMKKGMITLSIALALGTSCKKGLFEPNIDGTWREMKSKTDTSLTGCTLEIDKTGGNVTYCGIPFVHPSNVTAAFVKSSARLIIDNGQMYYREKKSSFFYLFPIAHDDLYFMDYEFDGSYLWVIGDASKTKSAVKGTPGAKIFRR
jgi:hypothetical protein